MKIRERRRGILALVGGLACLNLAACGAPPPPTAAASPPPPQGPGLSGEPALADRNWGVLRLPEAGLKLALPEAHNWLAPAADAKGGTWELKHEPSGSALSVRVWRASRLPRIAACDAELRQRVPNVPSVDESSLVWSHQVERPQGFVTRIELLSLPGTNLRLRGQVLAIGAGVGECLAAIASTECSSEAELAERLRLFDVALSHLRRIRIEDRVSIPEPPFSP